MDRPELKFLSWFWEGGEKIGLELKYLTNNNLEVRINKEEPHVTQEVFDRLGVTLDELDFFIGSEINVFGKQTILKQCDLATSNWIDSQARELAHIKESLMQNIRKYDLSHFPARLLVDHLHADTGKTNLQGLFKQIVELKTRLDKYRPSLAKNLIPSNILSKINEI